MFSCLQILEAFLWFVLITLLNVTLIILTLSVSRLLNLLLRLVAFLLFLNPQCLASISRWITASSSWKRFCLFSDEAVPSFVSGAMAKAGKGLLEGTLQAGTSAVSDKLLDLVGLGGKSAADKGKDTRDYLAAAFPELNAWERAGADASSAGM